MTKVIKRYTNVSALILLCFISAFIALYNGLFVAIKKSSLIKEEMRYSYQNEAIATITSMRGFETDQLFQIAEGIDTCNIIIDNMELYFDEIDGTYRPDVMLCHNESLSVPSGKAIGRISENHIVAPSSRIKDFRAVNAHGFSFAVSEVLDDQKYPFVAGLFVLNARDYFRAFPDALKETRQIQLIICSNKNEVYPAYAILKDNLKNILPDAAISSKEIPSRENLFDGMLTQEGLIFVGLFLFALLNSATISYYWIVDRRHEVAVRKAFGASNGSVIKMMASETMQLIGLAAFISFLVQLPLLLQYSEVLNFFNGIIMAVTVLFFVAAAVIISMIVPVRHILGIRPAAGVKL